MKICPICESQIEGKWCKSCHRFVTPMEIHTQVRLNESHMDHEVSGCEFHGDDNVTAVNKPIVRNTQPAKTTTGIRQQRKTSSQKSDKSRKKKNIGVKIAFIYFFFMVFANVAPFLFGGDWVDRLGEYIAEEFNANYVSTRKEPESVTVLETVANNQNVAPAAMRINAMPGAIAPIDKVADDDAVYLIYDAENISQLEFHCDGAHFEEQVDDLEDYMYNCDFNAVLDWENVQVYEDINYVYQSEEITYAWYNETYEYYTNQAFIQVEADTATKQVHQIAVCEMEKDSEEFLNVAYELLFHYAPDAYATAEDMKQDMQNRQDTAIIVEDVQITYECEDGLYTVIFDSMNYGAW